MSASDGAPAVTVGDPVVPILDIPPAEDLAVADGSLAAAAAIGGEEPWVPEQELPPVSGTQTQGEQGVALDERPTDVDRATATAIATSTTTTTITPLPTPLDNIDGSMDVATILGGDDAGTAMNTYTITEEAVMESVVPTEMEANVIPQVGGAGTAAEPGAAASDAPLSGEGGVEQEASEDVVTTTTTTTTTTTIVTITDTSVVLPEDGIDLPEDGIDAVPTPLEKLPSLGKREKGEEESMVLPDGKTLVAAVLGEGLPPPHKKAKATDSQTEAQDVDMQEEDIAVAPTEIETGSRIENPYEVGAELGALIAEGVSNIGADLGIGIPDEVAKKSASEIGIEIGDDLAKKNAAKTGEEGEAQEVQPVQLGPKTFHSSVEMFTYFYNLLHGWVSNVDVNKYEYMVLQDLIHKGHRDSESKIGSGIKAFQVRFHPGWHSRCYYLIRVDGTVDDFSYRKCVDKIMPLPQSLFSASGDLVVERLFPGEEDKWGKKSSKTKGNFGEGGGGHQGGKHSRGRRGGGRGGGRWSR